MSSCIVSTRTYMFHFVPLLHTPAFDPDLSMPLLCQQNVLHQATRSSSAAPGGELAGLLAAATGRPGSATDMLLQVRTERGQPRVVKMTSIIQISCGALRLISWGFWVHSLSLCFPLPSLRDSCDLGPPTRGLCCAAPPRRPRSTRCS